MTVSIEQTVATLRKRAAQASAARAAQAAVTRDRLFAAVAAHLAQHTEAWLIGSLAWGGFGEHSDIDVVVRGASPTEATRLELALVRGVGWPIDVLRFEELPDSFATRVEQEGIVLHGQ
ncbi:MAG: nucleotidyltransferase domain-containing protein [Planctomycetota bacterium]